MIGLKISCWTVVFQWVRLTTLFIKHKNQDILIVQIYVDDIIFGSTNEFLCKEFSSCMSK